MSFSAPNQERFVSILGTAQLTRERQEIQSKWQPGLEVWFPKGIDEPNIALLKIKVNKVDYWESSSSFMPQTISFIPHSADTKANLGIKNLEKVKPEKIAEQRFQAFIC